MRLKTLNGAPLCEHLDFSPDSLLQPNVVAHLFQEAPLLSSALRWRGLAATQSRLRTGWSQPHLPQGLLGGSNPDPGLPILGLEETTGSHADSTGLGTIASTFPDQTAEANAFAQHSFILHDTLISSQIAEEEEEVAVDSTVSSMSFMETSFETVGTGDERGHENCQPVLRLPPTLALTSLGSLPNAHHLQSIYPQTLTPNLLCVLIMPPEDKDVFVRRGGYKMSLRELIVADDTKSSFKISFWSRPSSEDSKSLSAQTLDKAKVGDILLLRNIALNSFRNIVYGQNLNPSITRVRTTVEILASRDGSSSRKLGAIPSTFAAAFVRLKNWAIKHVAEPAGTRKRRASLELSYSEKRPSKALEMYNDTLPPDTMESV